MNDRQRRFCEFYAACGNAAQAAREAGYSAKTARQQGERLLTNVDIAQYIRELQDRAAAGRIASMIQVRAFWSDVLNSPTEKTSDRLKAGELLARASGEFVNQAKAPAREEPKEDATDSTDTDQQQVFARIILPWNGRSPFNAVETDSGEIVPLSGSEGDDVWIYLPNQFTERKEGVEIDN